MKTSIVKIGNSQGVRIPKALLGDAVVGDAVEIQPSVDGFFLRLTPKPRAGWAEAAARMAACGDDGISDISLAGQFSWDNEDWTWE